VTSKVNRPHKRPGRRRKRAPRDAAERIEALAADGFSMRGIASGLDVAYDTLRKWLDEEASLRDAFERGRERERHVLHNRLYRIATESQSERDASIAAMFLLKARFGYREGDQSDSGNRVQVAITLPSALSMDQFKAIAIDGTARPADERDQSISTPRVAVARGS
jgi:hypothetical protein